MNPVPSIDGQAEHLSHLNDDQFADCAMGLEPTAAMTDHLTYCEVCREELAGFGVSVDSFNAASMAWSESRPLGSLQAEVKKKASWKDWGSRPFVVGTSWAMAGCMLLAVGISVGVRHEQGVRQAADVAAVRPLEQDSDEQIAQDNKMLMAVDVAIRSEERSPIEEYALQRVANARSERQGIERQGIERQGIERQGGVKN